MVKVCKKCKVEKPFDEFHKNKNNKDALTCKCKSCCKEYKKEYYQANKEKITEKTKEYVQANKKKIKEYKKEYQKANREKITEKRREYHKKYSEDNKEKIKEYYQANKHKMNENSKEYQRERRKTDPLFKMMCNLRNRTSKSFKNQGYCKNTRTQEMLGIDLEIAKQHIERQFTKGMNWNNYGEWHIDHIIPLASASTPERLKELCHYTNLQPLWAEDNLSKKDKIIGQQTLLRI